MLDTHTYYSSYGPNIRIDVNKVFVYGQNAKSTSRYEFIHLEAHRQVLIEFIKGSAFTNNVDYYFNPLTWIFYDMSDCEEINKGETTILGKKWYFRDIVYHRSSANCFLIRDLGYFTAWHDIFKVIYSQELPPYQCSSWKQIDNLEHKQQEYLKRFLNNMDEDIRISNFTRD